MGRGPREGPGIAIYLSSRIMHMQTNKQAVNKQTQFHYVAAARVAAVTEGRRLQGSASGVSPRAMPESLHVCVNSSMPTAFSHQQMVPADATVAVNSWVLKPASV